MQVFSKYDNYKDSSSPWLEKVPTHWRLLPGFAVVKENKEKNLGMIEETVLSLSYGKVIVKPPEKLTGLVPESFETYQIINPGDIIIRPTDMQNDKTSLRTGIANDRGIITSAYLCLRPIGNVNPKYLYYLLHTYDLMKVFYGLGSGLRQNLDFTDFKRMLFLLPEKEEQDRIVSFLDHNTHNLETIIKNKKRQLNCMYEFICTMVLTGSKYVKPVEKSDSWLGDFPVKWEIKKAKRIFNETNIRNKSEEQLLAVTQDRGVLPKKLCSQNYVSPSGDTSGLKFVKPDDFVISLRSFQGGIEYSQYSGIVSPAYNVFQLRDEYKSTSLVFFFKYLFKTERFIDLLNTVVSGIRDGKNINYSDFAELEIPLPNDSDINFMIEYFQLYENMKNEYDVFRSKLSEMKDVLTQNIVLGKIKI